MQRIVFIIVFVLASIVFMFGQSSGTQASATQAQENDATPSTAVQQTVEETGVHVGDQVDVRQLIEHAAANYKRNLEIARNYVYRERSVMQELNKDGSVKKTEIQTKEVSIVYGARYEKLIAKDDKPLDEKDARKEEEKYQKFFAEQKKKFENGGDAKDEEKREKETRELTDALVSTMKFTVVGKDQVEGHPVYVVDAEPDAQRKPHSRLEKMAVKLRGKLWIDENTQDWVRAEADLLDDFSVGLFLFKLQKGAHLEFDRTRVNDEIWLPRRTAVQASGRLLMFTGRLHEESTYSDYHRFKTDTKVLGVVAEGAQPAAGGPPAPSQK